MRTEEAGVNCVRLPSKLSTKWVIALVLVSVIGTAAAVVTLFTHTFPTVTTVTAVLTTTCQTLTLTPDTVVSGSSGAIVANCGASPAFTINSAGQATPTFTLPTGYTALGIFISGGGCPGTAVAITSGAPFVFTSGSVSLNVDYCAPFTSAPSGGLATFAVTWTQ